MIESKDELAEAWESLQTDEAILEEFVEFDREISVVAARNQQGEFAAYKPFTNSHRNHILDVTVVDADVTQSIENHAIDVVRQIMDRLDVIGVMCVEFFVTPEEQLLVNEIAPRPHNSGHLTIDAHQTCQFEQQVRAICGLPLGSTQQNSSAAMANLLGDLWAKGEPNWEKALSIPEIKLHLYGKHAARPGRKMGHLTATAPTGEMAEELVLQARNYLLEN